MNWLYYFLHEWPRGVRMQWAEAFFLPDDDSYRGRAIWLTVDCVGGVAPEDEFDALWHRKALKKLGAKSHHVVSSSDGLGDSDLLVARPDLAIDEFLEFAKIWFLEKGILLTTLTPAPLERFAGRSEQADLLSSLVKRCPKGSTDSD